jgi:hypothetical protein
MATIFYVKILICYTYETFFNWNPTWKCLDRQEYWDFLVLLIVYLPAVLEDFSRLVLILRLLKNRKYTAAQRDELCQLERSYGIISRYFCTMKTSSSPSCLSQQVILDSFKVFVVKFTHCGSPRNLNFAMLSLLRILTSREKKKIFCI